MEALFISLSVFSLLRERHLYAVLIKVEAGGHEVER